MNHSLFLLLCTLTIISAQGRSLQQSEGSVEPGSTAPVEAPSNRTFASSIEAANITANVSMTTELLDAWVDAGFYDVNSMDTFLLPTNEAWGKAFNSTSLNKTMQQQWTALHEAGLGAVMSAVALYHAIPNATLTSANLTDGLGLPTGLEGDGNLTVHVDPNSHSVTFVGFVNETNATQNTTNHATVLFPDIQVTGSSGVVMHVIDTVLEPPETAFNKSVQKFIDGIVDEEGGENDVVPVGDRVAASVENFFTAKVPAMTQNLTDRFFKGFVAFGKRAKRSFKTNLQSITSSTSVGSDGSRAGVTFSWWWAAVALSVLLW